MADYQRMIDDIRDQLSLPEMPLNAQTRQLAGDYVRACEDLNRRLHRCGEHLKQQLWCEAIHLAELDPNLIDAVAVLDFVERDHFIDWMRMHKLPHAPQLLTVIAEQLQDAYGRYESIKSPLSTLRVMNLKRASPGRRLGAMRELRKLDAGVPFWTDDIRAFEAHRLQEIERQAQQAAKRLDLDTIDRLVDELSQPAWSEPPAIQRDKVQKLRESIMGKASLAGLPSLTASLETHFRNHEAYFREEPAAALENDSAWTKAVALHDEWFARAESAGVLDTDPLFQRVAPISEEIQRVRKEQERERRRRVSLVELENVLSEPAATEDRLRQVRRTAAQWSPIPVDVERRFRRRVSELWWKKHWERVVGAVGFLVLVAVFLIFFFVNRN
jgi:hypothetical protein